MTKSILTTINGNTIKISEQDYEELSKHRWYLSEGYAITSINRKTVRMHRLVMNAPKNKQVDHINHDRLDNRRENLRLCSKRQNSYNSSKYSNNKTGYKGVFYRKRSPNHKKCWLAGICVSGKQINLGAYYTAEQAKEAYSRAATKFFGEFAHTGTKNG
jgi:hypothetical protein